ncbi:NF038122 family metalloprotease [Bradyrhizobium sp. DASA03076]|uniref:NF038122 family metalloprotease n=1 Tax=Bradyrhizobium sp. BLXBL-03 TaxID=3395916 RepID=UPI003F715CA3
MTTSPRDELLSDDPFYTVAGNSIQGSYIPATSGGSTGGSTSGSVMSVTSGGIAINLVLDAAAQAAPTSFKDGLQQAVAILAANITDKITVNINIDFSGTGGGAAAGPDSGYYKSYSWVRSELVNNASAGDITFNSLPTGATIQGQSNVAVWNAQLKLWGVISANDTTTDDASANFSTDINPNLLVGVALHELTHAMGRVPYGSAPDVFDLFRFTSPGVHLFQGGATAPAAYFSLDNGTTKLADYGQSSDPSDFLNSGVQGPNDPFNEFYTGTTYQGLTAIDLKQLDALGFHLTNNSPVVIEQAGATSLVQVGANYFLDSISSGTGPMLKYGGAAVTSGMWAGWAPIGAEQTGGGYDVAWKNASTGQYNMWSTDSNGNYVTNLLSFVSGTNAALESYEPLFHQDLNGDGVIGAPTIAIESVGSTSLVQVGNNYLLNPVAGGLGPELMFSGAPVTVGMWTGWAPIGAEQTGSGYDVAWKNASTGQYNIWSTDSNGNYVTNLLSFAPGTSAALQSYETTFHQDLNGDGVIGAPSIAIETAGSTSLVQAGSNYFLNPVAGGTGPELMFSGAPVTVGMWTGWAPIGAEQTGSGYDVAWKNASTSQYNIWSTDSNGNYVTNLLSFAPGTSAALQSYETTFHQDLNGDGLIGAPSIAIETAGSTGLVQVGNSYLLNPVAGGTGPELMFSGAPVTVGMWNGWAPIGAEQTGSGYDVAWKNASTGQYNIWSTDSNGNYVTNLLSFVSGTSTALQSFEPTFHQDLNSDGAIGIPASSGSAAGSSVATIASDSFKFGFESNNLEHVSNATLLGDHVFSGASQGELLNTGSEGASVPSFGPSKLLQEAVTHADGNLADLLSAHLNHLVNLAGHDLLP